MDIKFVNQTLFQAFNAAACESSEMASEILNGINLKDLRDYLASQGYNFNVFDDDSPIAAWFDEEELARNAFTYSGSASVFLKQHWFPFSQEEIDVVQEHLDEIERRSLNSKWSKLIGWDHATEKSEGIEKVVNLLYVLRNHGLIELVDESLVIPKCKEMDVKKIFGKLKPDIDKIVYRYSLEDCNKVLSKLYKVAKDKISGLDKEVIKFLEGARLIDHFASHGHVA